MYEGEKTRLPPPPAALYDGIYRVDVKGARTLGRIVMDCEDCEMESYRASGWNEIKIVFGFRGG